MAKPAPPGAFFPDIPKLSRALQAVYDLLTDDTDTVYDDAAVVADIATNLAAIANKLQTASYTEKIQQCNHAVDGTWTEVDLSGYGVQVGDEVDIQMHSEGALNNAGIRTLGSGLERRSDVGDHGNLSMRCIAGAGGVIEIYYNDASEFVKTYLVGYKRYSTS